MKEENVNFELLKKLVRENPNNYSLGEVIRKLVNQIEDEQQTNSLEKNDN
jgi:hypothetical protein